VTNFDGLHACNLIRGISFERKKKQKKQKKTKNKKQKKTLIRRIQEKAS
jgi:hypothetical protein